jgi:hypothetical protein
MQAASRTTWSLTTAMKVLHQTNDLEFNDSDASNDEEGNIQGICGGRVKE